MDQDILASNGNFGAVGMGASMDTILPDSKSTDVNQLELVTGGHTLFPSPSLFVPDATNQPTTTSGPEPQGSANIGSMSTADMFKAISDLEQPKRTLPGVRHYGSDAAM
jgi:hypothetical protein